MEARAEVAASATNHSNRNGSLLSRRLRVSDKTAVEPRSEAAIFDCLAQKRRPELKSPAAGPADEATDHSRKISVGKH
jgi:hypothetical protein